MMVFFGSNAIATILIIMAIVGSVGILGVGMNRLMGKGAFWDAFRKGWNGMVNYPN